MAKEEYIVDGKGLVSFTDKDYIATGGEAVIYGKSDRIYKIFLDPNNMIPMGKIKELSSLTLQNILKPLELIKHPKTGKNVGFTMLRIKDTIPFVKLVTNDFRNRFNIDTKVIIKLIENFKNGIDHIHSNKCLIVDANEFNFLTDMKTFNNAYFIDVNSYQTPTYPATAICLAIKDHNSNTFSTLTDWFSYAIVTFELLVGIHPFRGNNPGFKSGDIESRVKANISVLNKDTRTPPSIRPFSEIPKSYMSWYTELFEKGLRTPPPQISDIVVVAVARVPVTIGKMYEITKVKDFDKTENIINHFYVDNTQVTITKIDRMYYGYINNVKYVLGDEYHNVFFTKISKNPIFACISNGELKVKSLTTFLPILTTKAEDMFMADDQLFYIQDGYLIEANLFETKAGVIPSGGISIAVLPNATKVFDGLVIMDALGKPFFIIPYKNEVNKTACFSNMIKELTGLKILEAKHKKGVCIVISFDRKTFSYNKHILRFDKNYSSYHHEVINNVDYVGSPNFIVLDNGICVMVTEDDSIHVFNKNPNSPSQTYTDKIPYGSKLWTDGGFVYFSKDNELNKIKIRS